MSRFKNLADAQRAHIATLRGALGLLVLLSSGLWYGWQTAPQQLTIHVPPDLRTGSTRLWWDIAPENVYAVGLYLFQQLNRWPSDGEKDYAAAIYKLQPYLTPACRSYFEGDYEYRKSAGELRKRVRGVYEILGRGYVDNPTERVRALDRDTWLVNLDINVDEYYGSEPVKRAAVRYPLRVVRYDQDPENNAYGLALDCYEGAPQRLQLPEPPGDTDA